MDILNTAVNSLSGIVWGYVLIYLLVGAGIFFTFALGFIQFRKFGTMWGLLSTSGDNGDGQSISSFQALATGLAARVGTGNMAGIAVALTLGGPGAIFWMWMMALVGMATAFIEAALAQVFKQKQESGQFVGGPAYYMEKGLGQRWMGLLFCFFLILAFGYIFNAVQANTIAEAMHNSFEIPRYLTGGVLVVLAGLVVCGGIRGIAKFAGTVVPFMAMAYVAVALYVIVLHVDQVVDMFYLIVRSAFGLEPALGGAVGVAIMQGVKRGLFSNEAGMGSAPNIAAAADPTPRHPGSQGFIQMIGVFIDTIVICSCTAFIILLSDTYSYDPNSAMGGIAITQNALSASVGSWGGIFVALCIFLFSFTSLVANYSYTEGCIRFIKDSKTTVMLFRVTFLAIIAWGSLAKIDIVWHMADLAMGLMAIVNIAAILMLSKLAIKLYKDFNQQRSEGKSPTFDPDMYPELEGKIDTNAWPKLDK
ncbi:AGCS family alanine or glycine:cation symporter [Sinobacterium caligoides]|uniref:AGCS family alanine or glycine:cation symporter n=1 Tax=Sinobacterium caligoides TaxID=933926 RepID=A0A3N2DH58_9GAMM|nr:alanine/glycine:cation symporter family protein [Sinobacterium caligoides]ROR98958.1 AGCS family alanine or glycine:cation symporter [Sinobacterium caligoides]